MSQFDTEFAKKNKKIPTHIHKNQCCIYVWYTHRQTKASDEQIKEMTVSKKGTNYGMEKEKEIIYIYMRMKNYESLRSLSYGHPFSYACCNMNLT